MFGERLQLALAAADLGQDVAEARLRGHLAAGQLRASAATAGTGTTGALSARPSGVSGVANGQAARKPRSSSSGHVQALEQVPLVARADAHRRAEHLHLLLCHQPGMVVLVAGERQAHALDRVGDEAGRLVAVGLGGAQRLDHRLDVVAAEIGHQRAQFVVRQRIDDRARLASARGRPAAPAATPRRPGRSARNTASSGSHRSSARSASPPSRANAASSLRPYLMVTTFQPMSRNRPSMRPNSRSGTTESRLWRL